MLVLSRKLDQSIRIDTTDGTIEITVVRIDNGQVRLGIDAPRHIPVIRSEITGKPTSKDR